MKTIQAILIMICVGFLALGAAATDSYAKGCGVWNNFCGEGPVGGPGWGPGWGQECGPWNGFCGHGPMWPGKHNKHKKKCGEWNDFCGQGDGGMGGGGMQGGNEDGGGMGGGGGMKEGGGGKKKDQNTAASCISMGMKFTGIDDNKVYCVCDVDVGGIAKFQSCQAQHPGVVALPR